MATKRVVHIVGNGDNAHLYKVKKRIGLKLTCNLPPFPVPGAYASCIVDFKFMHAMTIGEVVCPGDWILGQRPKIWMDQHPSFYVNYSKQVKGFYTELPDYAANYTDFNCGHMATHFACNKLRADEVHLYGFDSVLDFNLRSITDVYLSSLRDNDNNYRLSDNWRPVWVGLFKEFHNTNFIFHHTHDKLKIPQGPNVSVEVYSGNVKAPDELVKGAIPGRPDL